MSHRASILGRGYSNRQFDSPRVRFRRALMLCLMTIIAPGSAQLALGNKWIGRIALTAWVALLGSIGYLTVSGQIDRRSLLDLATNTDFLFVVRAAIITVAVAWILLFLDAWRLGLPFRLNFARAVFLTMLNVAIIASAVGSTAYASNLVHTQSTVVAKVFKATKVSTPLKGRYNILLIGSDSGKDRTGVRTDSMTVVSIDANTGKTVLISLPRNLEKVPFPEDSPMRKVYPFGFNCGSECLLNAVHTVAANRTDLYPHSKDPGLDATIDAVRGVTGLKINYYTMINMSGFRSLVNAVGGVTVNVRTRIAMFGHDDAYVNKFIEPGIQKLDGQQALWYARSRVQSDDYTRMGRQKCLLSAMLNELSPAKVLVNATRILASGEDLLSTSIPGKELGQFAELALRSRKEKVMTVSLVPPTISTVNPDFVRIKALINDTIKKSEKSSTSPAPTKSPTGTNDLPTSTGTDPSQKQANATDDLANAC